MLLLVRPFSTKAIDMGIKEYIAAGLIAAAFLFGWMFNGYRWETKLDALKAEYASALQSDTEEAMKQQEKHSNAISDIDTRHTKELSDARNEIDKLRSDVASGSVGLRVNARCGSDLPQGKSSSSVGDARAAFLDEGARQHYFALRQGIQQVTAQLRACQDIVRSDRDKDAP